MTRFATGREPRFDIDLANGQAAEREVAGMIDGLSSGRTEVKCKSYLDDVFYVEYACRFAHGWADSGIRTSEADFWVFVVDDTSLGFMFGTELVRATFKRFESDARRHKEHMRGSHPTRGLLLELGCFVNEARKRRAES